MQYIAAIGLLKGNIVAEDYEDDVAEDPRIDELRAKMTVTENKQYSEDYLDPEKRSIANAMQVHFMDGTSTDIIDCEYPLGHRFRRKEAFPQIIKKYEANLATQFTEKQTERIKQQTINYDTIKQMAITDFIELFLD